MGYMTYYELTYENQNDKITDENILVKALLDIAPYLSYGEEVSFEELFCEGMKWYDHNKDMKELSKQFPNILFKLHGNGEDFYDTWNKYFLNGKMQFCQAEIVYPPFDPDKLV